MAEFQTTADKDDEINIQRVSRDEFKDWERITGNKVFELSGDVQYLSFHVGQVAITIFSKGDYREEKV